MGKSGILAHTKHKVAEIQPQINLQFHFTVKLSKLGEIVNQYGWQEMQFVNKHGWQEVGIQYGWLPVTQM